MEKNNEDIIKRALLLMKYESKNTLTENEEVIDNLLLEKNPKYNYTYVPKTPTPKSGDINIDIDNNNNNNLTGGGGGGWLGNCR